MSETLRKPLGKLEACSPHPCLGCAERYLETSGDLFVGQTVVFSKKQRLASIGMQLLDHFTNHGTIDNHRRNPSHEVLGKVDGVARFSPVAVAGFAANEHLGFVGRHTMKPRGELRLCSKRVDTKRHRNHHGSLSG